MQSEFRLAVLITCHNRREITLACLKALFANHLPRRLSLSVILVDDGSTDGTELVVSECFPVVEIIKGDGTLFWNGGMRRAFARSLRIGFNGYLWLNDDTSLYPTAIESLLSTLKDIRRDGERSGIIVGSTHDSVNKILTYGGVVAKSRLRPFRYMLVEPQSSPVECDTMNGNCVLVPHEVAKALGNLEPRFVHAMGDMDYGLRARKAGFCIWVAPGYVGTCSNNPNANTFTDRSLSLLQRWKRMMQPKGLPPASWLLFTRRHAGLFWPVYFVWPYLSIVLDKFTYRHKGSRSETTG